MAEPSAPDQPKTKDRTASMPRRGLQRLGAMGRAQKVLTAVIAVAGFLGLGGIFGQWAVERVGDVIGSESAPKGFDELHAAWRDTAKLNERLLLNGAEANKQLEDGVRNTGKLIPPELIDDLVGLQSVRREASALVGRVRATDTDLTGPRADLVRLVTLIRDGAKRAEDGIRDAYFRTGGQPVILGSGGFAPIFSNELREKASAQDGIKRQVAAGLAPTARRFDRPIPRIRGWARLVFPYALGDTPNF